MKWLLALAALLAAATGPAWALPLLTPHPHGAGKVRFGPADGSDNHNHLFDKDPRLSTADGFVWDAFSVWDNRKLRLKRDALLDSGIELQTYAHGFIDAGHEPRYKFIDGPAASVTFDAGRQKLVAGAVDLWVKAARAESAGKKAPDGTALVTGLGLTATAGKAFEFSIGFYDELREQHGTAALWVTIPNQRWAKGATKAEIEDHPLLAFDDDLKWLFSDDPTKVPAPCKAVVVDECEIDFFSVVIHEIGHVLGLDHTPSGKGVDPLIGPEGFTMRSGLAFKDAIDGKTFRKVDQSSARGIASLYTQTVPAPGTAWLVVVGVVAAAFARHRARRRRQRWYPPRMSSSRRVFLLMLAAGLSVVPGTGVAAPPAPYGKAAFADAQNAGRSVVVFVHATW